MTTSTRAQTPVLAAILLALSATSGLAVATSETEKRPLELTDIMQFREIEQRATSENGAWLAFAAVPDFGDSQGQVVNTLSGERFYVERGDRPQLSRDGRFVAFRQQAPLLQREQAAHDDADDELKEEAKRTHMVVVDTESGEQTTMENIERFSFTGDGLHLVMLQAAEDNDKKSGQQLVIRALDSGTERTLTRVTAFTTAEQGPRVAVVRLPEPAQESDDDADQDAAEKIEQLLVINTRNGSQLTLQEGADIKLQGLAFNHQGTSLAYLQGPSESDNPDPAQQLWLWQYGQQQASLVDTQRAGYVLSEHASPSWSEDDSRLFIGFREAQDTPASALAMPQSHDDLYNLERLTSDRRLQVWHGDDERIVTHQRETHSARHRATTPAVVWLDERRVVHLGTDIEDSWRQSEHPDAQLISSSNAHLREISWNGFYHDIDHVNLHTGERQNVVSRVRSSERGALSPDGRYVAYLNDEQYYVFDATSGESTAVASDIEVSWVDEQNDRPMEASAYGVAGWLDDNSGFLAYDRYDIWKITIDGEATQLTDGGRDAQKQFRVRALDDALGLPADGQLLVHSYSDSEKYHGFWSLDLSNGEFTTLIEDKKRYQFVEYLAEQERVIFSEEDFRQFPDLLSAPLDFSERTRLTDVNPQVADFSWGDPELIDWQTDDGDTLQGIVIKPDNYDSSRTYPVMVYYYEQFSQRMYHFNQMKVNHRPNFPFYVGQDYVVFLPDIRFRLGAPGPSATESLVPGVNKLIEMGIADPDAIGLHGHSWSGYMSAFVVTETDMFAAVVSGAPVSNMTSAYTGIRWQSGLARQFQYETGQSRLGPSMYEDLAPYIKNSPVFFADQINTPMLIQFGDADGAVPWEQGIEYYLALRQKLTRHHFHWLHAVRFHGTA
ncbi:MAG: prolyl oligopeptidase family serine peptidase [Gammaproteobacteria bacterium]|nr:prolyl oligopeptidase family serine peptidase [Gammaproteobacteria bacterium]